MHPSDRTGREGADRELDDYLAGRSPLSARYRAVSRETPAPELDRAILDHARAATRQPSALRPSWQQRWAVPVGIAATLVVGVDLAWRVSDRARSEDAAREPALVLSEDAGATQRSRIAAAPPDAPAVAATPPGEATPLDADRLAEFAADAMLRQEAAEIQAFDDLQLAEAAKAEGIVGEDSVDPAAGETFVADAPDAAPSAPQSQESTLASSGLAEEQDAEVIQAEQALRAAKRRAAERRAVAPQAAMMAAPEPEPLVPRRGAEAARTAADEVAALLRSRDFDGLRQRYPAAALTRQALEGAATVFDDNLRLRLIEEADGTWRADYLDAGDQLRCALRLRPAEDGWSLVGLATRP